MDTRAWSQLTAPAPGRPPSVTELAAHWHFSDSSHFIRAFKKQYGRTPGDMDVRCRPESDGHGARSAR